MNCFLSKLLKAFSKYTEWIFVDKFLKKIKYSCRIMKTKTSQINYNHFYKNFYEKFNSNRYLLNDPTRVQYVMVLHNLKLT